MRLSLIRFSSLPLPGSPDVFRGSENRANDGRRCTVLPSTRERDRDWKEPREDCEIIAINFFYDANSLRAWRRVRPSRAVN
jgi:hypothetical protein